MAGRIQARLRSRRTSCNICSAPQPAPTQQVLKSAHRNELTPEQPPPFVIVLLKVDEGNEKLHLNRLHLKPLSLYHWYMKYHMHSSIKKHDYAYDLVFILQV